MRYPWRAVAFAALVSLSPIAATASPADEIRDVIGDQIEAFRANDLDRAFGFASPFLQRYFATPGNFGRMVRQGYPMVWRPRSVEFRTLREDGDKHFQDVLFVDQGGAAHLLRYELRRGPDGWRIHAVEYLEPLGAGV